MKILLMLYLLFSLSLPPMAVTPRKPPAPIYKWCWAGENDNPYDGYYDIMGYCVPGLISIDTWFQKQPRYTYGKALYYAPGAMEATANWRGLSLDGYKDGVSLISPADIGETVWLRRNGEWEGPFLSVDASARSDMYAVAVLKQEVVEVGFKTAREWGLVDADSQWDLGWEMVKAYERTVEVWIGDEPPSALWMENITPVYYAQHWLDTVEYSSRYEQRPVFHFPNYWDMRDGHGVVCLLRKCLETPYSETEY